MSETKEDQRLFAWNDGSGRNFKMKYQDFVELEVYKDNQAEIDDGRKETSECIEDSDLECLDDLPVGRQHIPECENNCAITRIK